MSRRKPMSQQTLLERLNTLERRIDEATRRAPGASVPIASVELDEPAPVITLSELPQHYHALQLYLALGGTQASGPQWVQLRVNGHAGDAYEFQYVHAYGGTNGAGSWSGVEHVEIAVMGFNRWPISSWTTATIGNYAAADRTFFTGHCAYAAGTSNFRMWLASGWQWKYHEPVTSLSLHPAAGVPFSAGSSVRVYGLR